MAKCQCTVVSIGTTEVYVITLAVGSGVEEDPYRHVVEWRQGNKLLLREDPYEANDLQHNQQQSEKP